FEGNGKLLNLFLRRLSHRSKKACHRHGCQAMRSDTAWPRPHNAKPSPVFENGRVACHIGKIRA
ncbi:hypothetical protein, partial [Mesorhizobium sp. M2A.F.Ca.ET.067.02.1.1]|uniref:hypothetical protein n=1 Tax=Mesorhizobium sp. M2A.F.Ca.ET.067.02.1.1 TaxID=2496749 RepID=UPI001AEC8AAB